jgi:hypothetical protein
MPCLEWSWISGQHGLSVRRFNGICTIRDSRFSILDSYEDSPISTKCEYLLVLTSLSNTFVMRSCLCSMFISLSGRRDSFGTRSTFDIYPFGLASNTCSGNDIQYSARSTLCYWSAASILRTWCHRTLGQRGFPGRPHAEGALDPK